MRRDSDDVRAVTLDTSRAGIAFSHTTDAGFVIRFATRNFTSNGLFGETVRRLIWHTGASWSIVTSLSMLPQHPWLWSSSAKSFWDM